MSHRLWSQVPSSPRKQAEVTIELKFSETTRKVPGRSFPPCTTAAAISITLHADHLSQAFAEIQTVNLHFLSVIILPHSHCIPARSACCVQVLLMLIALSLWALGNDSKIRSSSFLQPLTSPRGRRWIASTPKQPPRRVGGQEPDSQANEWMKHVMKRDFLHHNRMLFSQDGNILPRAR